MDADILSASIRMNLRLLFNSLKIVVEHSSMTNQTHLFRQLDGGRPDQSATPGTQNVIHGWLLMVLRMDSLTQSNLPD
jgi:hypothetical protein